MILGTASLDAHAVGSGENVSGKMILCPATLVKHSGYQEELREDGLNLQALRCVS
jgi:hypothetical protein